MDPDLLLVIGIIIGAFSIPSILSALSDKRAPRASVLTVLIAGVMIFYAAMTKPGGFALDEVPDTFVSVFARYLP